MKITKITREVYQKLNGTRCLDQDPAKSSSQLRRNRLDRPFLSPPTSHSSYPRYCSNSIVIARTLRFPETTTFPENCSVQNSVRGGNSRELKCGSVDRAISNWKARGRSKQWLQLGIFPGNKRKRKEKKVRESGKCERKRKEKNLQEKIEELWLWRKGFLQDLRAQKRIELRY